MTAVMLDHDRVTFSPEAWQEAKETPSCGVSTIRSSHLWHSYALNFVVHLNVDHDQRYFHGRTQSQVLTNGITVYSAHRYASDPNQSFVPTLTRRLLAYEAIPWSDPHLESSRDLMKMVGKLLLDGRNQDCLLADEMEITLISI